MPWEAKAANIYPSLAKSPPPRLLLRLRPSLKPSPLGGGVFDNVLGNFVNEVNGKHVKMGNSLQAMLSGQNVPLHQVMTEFQEAGVAFTMMVELRNKLLASYKELMSMGL